jgi:hypothetical protein
MSYEIDLINKKYKITDYLTDRGIKCQSHDNSRYRYKCPLPKHSNDKTPSFFVFDKGDTQDFFASVVKYQEL